jgi:toxin ParE1/3/4
MRERRIVTHEQALRDLANRAEYIRRHNPRAALRFLDAAEAAFRRLAATPGMGARYAADHPALTDIRFFPIARFKNDLVFYRPLGDGIEVLRVLHGARDIDRILANEFELAEDDTADAEGEGDE